MAPTPNEQEPTRKSSNFFQALLRNLRQSRNRDIRVLCEQLLSQRGEASQAALAGELIATYVLLTPESRLEFFKMLARDFGPQAEAIHKAASLDRMAVRQWAQQFTLEAVAPRYEAWFDRLQTLWGEGWYA